MKEYTVDDIKVIKDSWEIINRSKHLYIRPEMQNGEGMAALLVMSALQSGANNIHACNLGENWWCVSALNNWIEDTKIFKSMAYPKMNMEVVIAAMASELYSGVGENIDFQKGDGFPFEHRISLEDSRWIIFRFEE